MDDATKLELKLAALDLDFESPSKNINVGASDIAGAGRGLLAAREIAAFETVFSVEPVVLTVEEGHEDHACDWCHAMVKDNNRVDTGGNLLPGAREVTILMCNGCHKCGYCSKVGSCGRTDL